MTDRQIQMLVALHSKGFQIHWLDRKITLISENSVPPVAYVTPKHDCRDCIELPKTHPRDYTVSAIIPVLWD
jgi:hypothetical protein